MDHNKAIDIAEEKVFKLQDLRKTIEEFLKIEKSLNDFIREKRLKFPRFYFFSDDEMIEVLMFASQPGKISPYLKKCFEAIDNLRFEADYTIIMAIVSPQKEELTLGLGDAGLSVGGQPVENWLKSLEVEMKDQIKKRIKKFYLATSKYEENNEKRSEYILYPIS